MRPRAPSQCAAMRCWKARWRPAGLTARWTQGAALAPAPVCLQTRRLKPGEPCWQRQASFLASAASSAPAGAARMAALVQQASGPQHDWRQCPGPSALCPAPSESPACTPVTHHECWEICKAVFLGVLLRLVCLHITAQSTMLPGNQGTAGQKALKKKPHLARYRRCWCRYRHLLFLRLFCSA